MRTFINISLAVAALFAVSCQKEMEYELPVDVAWTSYSSITNDEISEGNLKVAAGDYIFLRDASQGTLSHEWIIDDNAEFFTDLKDASSTIEAKSTLAKDAYVVFNKSGVTTVTLRNTYAEKVISNTNPRIESVYDESIGAWVFTKTIEVEAYGKLKPAYSVFRIGLDGIKTELFSIAGDEETSQDNLREVTISQGDRLQFVYDTKSEYKSDNQSYTVPSSAEADGGDSASGIFTFNKITEAGKPLTGFSITATREEISVNSGKGVIPAAIAKKVIPISLIVKYAPISAILSGVKQSTDGKIMLAFNKALATIPSGIEDCFKLYKNGSEISISSVELYEDSYLLLTADDADITNLNNYGVSDVTLSYTPTSSCNLFATEDSEQKYPAAEFSDVNVVLYNILNSDYFDFKLDSSSATELIGGWWASFTTAKPSATGSSISFIESFNDQESVVCFDVKSTVNNNPTEQLILKLDEKLESSAICQAGDYTLKCRLFVESVAGSTANLDLKFGNWITAGSIDLTTQGTGVWIDYSAPFTTTATGNVSGFMIQVKKGQFSDDASAKFYIDDLYIIKR